MKKTLMLVGVVVMLAGCSFVRTQKNSKMFDETERVDIAQSFYLLLPKDGHELSFFAENRIEKEGSGKEAAAVFYKKFHKKFGSIVMGENNMTVAEGLAEAKARGDRYMITLDVIEWNDEFYMFCRYDANSNSVPKTDSMDVSVQVYDVASGRLLNKQRLENKGCPIVFLGFIPIGTMGPKGRFIDSLDSWLKAIQ